MTKLGIYKNIIEGIMTAALLFIFPFRTIFKIKLFILYFIIMHLAGRYRKSTLLIWDELELMFKGYLAYFASSLLIIDYVHFQWQALGWLVLFLLVQGVCNLLIARFTHLIFWKQLRKNALVIGAGHTARQLQQTCKVNRYSLLNVKGFVNCNNDPTMKSVDQELVEQELPVYLLRDLEKVIEKEKIETVLIAIPEMNRIDQRTIVERIMDKVETIKYLPRMEGLVTFDTKIDDFDGLLMISTSQGTISRPQAFLKRLIDIFAGLAGMMVLGPLTLYVRHLNHKQGDRDPLFFTQTRIGKDGRPFTIYKFRTMVPNAEQILDELMEKDESIRKEYTENKKLKNDPRITKAGDFLRRTSLDEFPQFINVLKGEMSLIGPRPYLPREKEDMGERYDDIVSSKPGITGMWQTHGRSEVNFEQRLELDEYYYRNWSLWLDTTLLIRTIKQIINKDEGAI